MYLFVSVSDKYICVSLHVLAQSDLFVSVSLQVSVCFCQMFLCVLDVSCLQVLSAWICYSVTCDLCEVN